MRSRHLVALAASIATAVSLTLAASPASATVSSASATATSPASVIGAPADVVIDPAKRMPSDVPSKKTPWVTDGEVSKIVQIGANTMVAGGLFTTVTDPMNGTQYTRQNLFAFDKTTGLVSQTFNPTTDGQVQQLLPGPTPTTVYVGGDFTKINNKGPNHLQLLDITTGLAVTSFKAPSTNGGIETMELLPNNRLFIGGFFTKIGGVTHGQLGTLNATTGAVDPYIDITVAQHHNNSGTGAQAPIGPRESGVTPAGDRLIVVGNFKQAGGLARDQIVMIDLGANSGTVSTTWATTLYTPICSPGAFDSYMRDVEMSPDGSYFVVAVTGGPHTGTLCDTATRWDPYATGTTLSPLWTTSTGGDTLWGVGITGNAVYVGGHERWMNNPNGSDRAAQGAVPRPGIVALDPLTGIPLKWNPGRNPRGEAVYDIYPVAEGIYLVSDTDWIGDRRYQRPRIAFFPYETGYNIASTAVGSLPGNVYIASPQPATSVLYRVNAGGSQVAAIDGGINWAADTSASPSPFHNTGSITATQGALAAGDLVNVPSSTPLGIWTSERNDPSTAPEMQWSFPVTAGTSMQVRLFFASRSSQGRRFNVLIDGVTKLSNYDPNTDPGLNKGTMKAFDVTSDGTVNIDFTHVLRDPEVNAIEILAYSGGAAATTANVVSYNGTTIASQTPTTTANFDWTNVRGAVMVGRSLFYGNTDGLFYKRSFDGVNFGDPVLIDPYRDPLWANVPTGSGPTSPVQTYVGVIPTWYSTSTTTGIAATTGMFYWNGRLYYTKSGSNSLFWRYFVPDAGIVGAIENTIAGGNITWSNTKGMFIDGNKLYVVSATDGSLMRIDFVNGAPSGSSTIVNSPSTGGIDWRGRALFLSSVLPNAAPSASFTESCTATVCDFDSSATSDSDGTIQSYDWDFGDGEGSGEASPQHDFLATGTYTVSLTVTDDQGTEGTTTHQVSVVKPNVPPTADFTATCTFLDCTFESTSTDSDGTVDGTAWDFGDGDTDSVTPVIHSFDAPGQYDVQLTATDDDGASDDVTKTITVNAAPAATTVTYVDTAVNQGNVTTPNVTAPVTVQDGDRLVMALSLNASNRIMQPPTGITGWTVLDTTTTPGMATRLYTKVATAVDAGKKVTVTIDLASKYTMSMAVYRGVRDGTQVFAALAETESRTTHTTPPINAPAGAWVVSYWADKSSLTTGFALPADVTSRGAICGSITTGHVCSVLADSNGAVPTGSYPGHTATADTASSNATTWVLILKTQEPNVLPTAAFTQTCTSLGCDFDASASSDSDGTIASYAWDFGDAGTGSGASPSHTFPATGTYDVSLTVTDNETGQNTVMNQVSVVRTNAAPVAAYSQTCTFLDCSFDGSASTDSDGTISTYAWDFGDGETANVAVVDHPFPDTGSYQVALTVTDNDGSPTTLTKTINVIAEEPIAFVGNSSNLGNVATPNTTVPVGATPGDRLIMILNVNANNRVLSDPTGVTGWNLLETTVSGAMATTVYTKVAVAGDGGHVVRVPMDLAAKYTMTVAAYSGDMLVPTYAAAAETVNRADHTTPTANAPDNAWVVSAWADRSSATTTFTLPGTVTARGGTVCAASTGRVCSVLADSGAPVAAGQVGGITATSDSSQASATMWTIVLRPM